MELLLRLIENKNKCKSAIMELRGNITVPKWVNTHALLFKDNAIQPEGRPSISDSHCDGVHYEWISNLII
jgi:hypothetical protein